MTTRKCKGCHRTFELNETNFYKKGTTSIGSPRFSWLCRDRCYRAPNTDPRRKPPPIVFTEQDPAFLMTRPLVASG